MKIIINTIIPFRGYIALTFWPFVFVRKDLAERFDDVTKNHECIHARQQKEMLLLFFYLWYAVEFLVKWIGYGFSAGKAYRNIGFEREAYDNESEREYLGRRRRFAWLRYVVA